MSRTKEQKQDIADRGLDGNERAIERDAGVPVGTEQGAKTWPVCKCGHASNMHHAAYCILCAACVRFEVAR